MARTDERFRQAFNALLADCEAQGPGHRLGSEPALSARLDVSRTVIRAALARLDDLGIISWTGRDKIVQRRPGPEDRLATANDPPSPPDLERQFLDWILRFDVHPGTVLNVSELSRRFRVTPHLLQTFLGSFSRFGLVRMRRKGGWELLGFTRDFAVELSDIRLMLELNAVGTLVATPDQHPVWASLDDLARRHRHLEERIDTDFHDFSLLDEAFHRAVNSVVTNRFAAELQQVIALIFHYHFQWDKTNERQRNKAAIAEHLRIIAALRARDAPAALAATEDHIRTSKLTLLQSLRDHALP